MRVLLLLAVLPLAWAQFPAVCNNDESLTSKKCCPNECFSDIDVPRGTCIDVSTTVMKGWNNGNDIVNRVCNRDVAGVPQDVRCRWPIRVFNKVCSCKNGWGGYDCSQCDFGYILNAAGNGCVKRTDNQLRVRRNFMSLDDDQREEYISVLRRAKNEPVKEWSVVVEEPTDSSGRVKLQDVSVYDMLVIHHFLATREKDNDNCQDRDMFKGIDFAHEGPTFLTWHRYYLLIVERELQRVAKGMGIHDFELAYWDWSSSKMFTPALFGTPDYSSGSDPIEVSGGLFNDNDWPVLCNYHYEKFLAGKKGVTPGEKECEMVRKLCNVSANRDQNEPLRRGFIESKDKPFLPDSSTIKMALTARIYTGDTGFNQRTEGFVELCPRTTADTMLPCLFRNDKMREKTHNNLHNAVHIYIGGHMRDVPTASNDPIFFLHHANIDRIFEAWLRKFNGGVPSYEPNPQDSAIHPGHGPDDYLVPFFPLKTNRDMYNLSSHLGFEYDTLPEIALTDSDIDGECGFREPESDLCDKKGTPGAVTSTTNPTSRTTNPRSQGSGFHVSLYLISVAGTCAVLIVSKLSDIL